MKRFSSWIGKELKSVHQSWRNKVTQKVDSRHGCIRRRKRPTIQKQEARDMRACRGRVGRRPNRKELLQQPRAMFSKRGEENILVRPTRWRRAQPNMVKSFNWEVTMRAQKMRQINCRRATLKHSQSREFCKMQLHTKSSEGRIFKRSSQSGGGKSSERPNGRPIPREQRWAIFQKSRKRQEIQEPMQTL